jgi:hypothetical protein
MTRSTEFIHYPRSIHEGGWQFHFLRARASTFEGGTTEIMLNILGERVLGLPKDMSRKSRA